MSSTPGTLSARIQAIRRDVDETGKEIDNGVASWKLRCGERDEEYPLQIRYNGKAFEKSLVVDGRRYAEPVTFYDDDTVLRSEIDMADREYKPFAIIPRVSWLAMPPWIVGYLIIVLPFSFLLKPKNGFQTRQKPPNGGWVRLTKNHRHIRLGMLIGVL